MSGPARPSPNCTTHWPSVDSERRWSNAAARSGARSPSARTTSTYWGVARCGSSLLQVRYVSAEGRIVNGGGPTVKNVTGFDLPRLMVGSLGTLGLLAEVIVRTNPIPPVSVWLASADADPFATRDALLRPSAVLWDGVTTWVLLEGHAADLAAEQATLARLARFDEVSGPPPLPSHRWSLAPGELRTVGDRAIGSFVAVVGVGLAFGERAQPERPLSPPVREIHRPDEGQLRPDRTPQPRSRRGISLMDLGIDADELNTCVQCGLCLSACPTFRVTGDETMSPRGRIALMREVQLNDAPLTPEVVDAFETCVQCRGCEPACPSSVPYGRLMERTREALVEQGVTPGWQRAALAPLAHPRLLRAGSVALGVAQRLHVVPKRLGLSTPIPLRQSTFATRSWRTGSPTSGHKREIFGRGWWPGVHVHGVRDGCVATRRPSRRAAGARGGRVRGGARPGHSRRAAVRSTPTPGSPTTPARSRSG